MKLFGFDCVLRGLRLGKALALDDWPENRYIYMKGNIITIHYENLIEEEYTFKSKDILSRDWTICSLMK
jgi:hypothetical protein